MMMHYCVFVYTKEFPTDEAIGKALKPYRYKDGGYEDGEQRPLFTWDWWQAGGRYGGKFKLNISDSARKEKYKILEYTRYRRSGTFFRSAYLEKTTYAIGNYRRDKLEEDEALQYCGTRDGYIYVDGAWANDIKNLMDEADNCWAVIDTDGTAIAREHWDGADLKDDDQFADKAKAIAVKNRADAFVTVVDIHD